MVVQGKVHGQGVGGPAQRRVVAHGGAEAVDHGLAVHQLGQQGLVQAGLRQDELEVVVKPRAGEVAQLAHQGQAQEAGADLLARQQLQVAGLEGVAHAFESGGRGGHVGGHAGFS